MVDKSSDKRNWEAYTAMACISGALDAAMVYTCSAAIGQYDANMANAREVSASDALNGYSERF